MKKLVVFAVCALMSATASFGVNFTFTEVTKVEQSGNGFIAYAGSESISISALQYTQMQNASGWYILNGDGTVRSSLVTLGRHFDTSYEVLSGVNEGDRVAVRGSSNLRDGSKVEVVE